MKNEEYLAAGVGIATALIGLTTISVLLSSKAQTPQVIQAIATAFSNILSVAVSPITGNSSGQNQGSGQ